MNLHVEYQSGPLIAVDVENNIDLHWRAHGVPLRTLKTAVANLHYISNEIDDLAGGPHTVIMFNLGPHFTTYPLDFFTHRVLRIRKAILALLQRAPDTTVIIKTVNTGYKVSLYSIMCSNTKRPHCDGKFRVDVGFLCFYNRIFSAVTGILYSWTEFCGGLFRMLVFIFWMCGKWRPVTTTKRTFIQPLSSSKMRLTFYSLIFALNEYKLLIFTKDENSGHVLKTTLPFRDSV